MGVEVTFSLSAEQLDGDDEYLFSYQCKGNLILLLSIGHSLVESSYPCESYPGHGYPFLYIFMTKRVKGT